MQHRIRVITLLNEFEQEILLPTQTQVLSLQEGGFIPEMHVLMRSDQPEYDEYTIRLLTAFHKPVNMHDFVYVNNYVRKLDGMTVHCFYQRRKHHERKVSDETPNH